MSDIDEKELSRYVNNLQDRYPAFVRAQRHELKHDVISRLITGYLFTGSRLHFEDDLQGMLTEAERQLLSTNPTFTRAWQIFADLCWLKRKFTRVAILLGIILGLLGFGVFLLWAAPYVTGPKSR